MRGGSVAPLVVVRQRPVEIAAQIDTAFACFGQDAQMVHNELRPLFIVARSDTVFSNKYGQAVARESADYLRESRRVDFPAELVVGASIRVMSLSALLAENQTGEAPVPVYSRAGVVVGSYEIENLPDTTPPSGQLQ